MPQLSFDTRHSLTRSNSKYIGEFSKLYGRYFHADCAVCKAQLVLDSGLRHCGPEGRARMDGPEPNTGTSVAAGNGNGVWPVYSCSDESTARCHMLLTVILALSWLSLWPLARTWLVIQLLVYSRTWVRWPVLLL